MKEPKCGRAMCVENASNSSARREDSTEDLPENAFHTFRSLSPEFHRAYFEWHSSGQYEGVREFQRVEDVWRNPPPRERDDWYREELRIIDKYYRRLSDSRVLEIGCGDGNLTWKLSQRCKSLVACDIDPKAVEITRARLKDMDLSDVELQVRSGENIRPDEGGAYDVVFFVQVLEHVPGWEQEKLFDRIFSLVAPGGCLFISTPNRWTLRDGHDTGKLLIHWFPRWIKVPIARLMRWGLEGHDPAWPYPPVLHDYVSFGWMQRRARRAYRGVVASQMSFYPNAGEWLKAKSGKPGKGAKHTLRRIFRQVGRLLPLNYYFGDKVIFSKRLPFTTPRDSEVASISKGALLKLQNSKPEVSSPNI